MMAPNLWSLWDIMQRFAAKDIVGSIAFLSSFATKWEGELGRPQDFTPESYANFTVRVEALEKGLLFLEAPISHDHATALVGALDQAQQLEGGVRRLAGQNLANAWHAMNQICQVAPMELGNRLIVCLRGPYAGLYEQDFNLFGEEVDEAFPGSAEDISEAGKCLALERYTAAVFHLMRGMEDAIAVLADKLGATVANDRGEMLAWGILTSNIGEKVKAMEPGQEKDEWLGLHTLLFAVNRAFRTKTAHPKKTYTADEAERAMHATRSFMQAMAERLNA
ncbi:hypothetical protein [Sphingomonas sp. MS122]|uniref:hypothetical protein n=1 Tax=Sphingomonas sp. MS122 TaxID=3412683 RepID=UPI003C2D6DC1